MGLEKHFTVNKVQSGISSRSHLWVAPVFSFSSWETLWALRELIFPYHAFLPERKPALPEGELSERSVCWLPKLASIWKKKGYGSWGYFKTWEFLKDSSSRKERGGEGGGGRVFLKQTAKYFWTNGGLKAAQHRSGAAQTKEFLLKKHACCWVKVQLFYRIMLWTSALYWTKSSATGLSHGPHFRGLFSLQGGSERERRVEKERERYVSGILLQGVWIIWSVKATTENEKLNNNRRSMRVILVQL